MMKKTQKPPNPTTYEVSYVMVCEEEASDYSRAWMEGLFGLQNDLPSTAYPLSWEGCSWGSQEFVGVVGCPGASDGGWLRCSWVL